MKRVLAAGGIVLNQYGELLMIFRRTKWDLPKGHYEYGEDLEQCAIREVREETGAKNIQLVRFVGVTKHYYFDSLLETDAVKETHWFEMRGDKNDLMIGQLAESIEWVIWAPPAELDRFLNNSYHNIREILAKAGVVRRA